MRALIACLLLGLVVASARAADSDGAAAPAEREQQVLVLLSLPPAHFRPDGNYTAGYADAAGSATRRRIAAALARSNGLTPGDRLAAAAPRPRLLRHGRAGVAARRRRRDAAGARPARRPGRSP